ncbi:hypothetical protein EST38_g9134 [Candolleomyces aberdarensis]|uniref:Transcriptional coactivator p15 (PC4) C-terminal domain-containing protein n=1 Tax=Candolleomyces aberdarensis TaxID=2316362 RepID=A0A4Q2DAP7_9AGAR|nr:hypothetical protein EST38_g9134 [Candolleomyces aberdarensis]
MAKRKAIVSEDESAAHSEEESEAVLSESDSDEPQPKSKGKGKGKGKGSQAKKASIKKPKYKKSASEDDGSEEEQPIAKKPKREEKKKASSSSSAQVLKNSEGEKYVDLGKKKHATVRTFKGMKLVDIREYYNAGGEDKPGKKGISLTLDQWNTLIAASDTIDQLLQDIKAT